MKPVPGCRWVADHLLVRTRKAAKLALPQPLLRAACEAGVACVVNLLSKAEYLADAEGAAFDPVARLPVARPGSQRNKQPRLFMSYVFWPEPGCLPTARQVRQATDWIEDAHALGLCVLLNGVGHPARAAIVADCWRAREDHGGGDEGVTQRNGFVLSAAERTFVAAWPTGREGQPELADMAWSELDEVFPLASAEHWLRTLPTVRVYAGTRSGVRPVDVPVQDGQRASDGRGIDLDLEELHRGTWIGERTLLLPYGWQVIFVSPYANREVDMDLWLHRTDARHERTARIKTFPTT